MSAKGGPVGKFLRVGAVFAGIVVFGPATCTATWKSVADNPDDEAWHTLFARDFTRYTGNLLGGVAKEGKDMVDEAINGNDLTIPSLPRDDDCDYETLEDCDFNDFEEAEPASFRDLTPPE